MKYFLHDSNSFNDEKITQLFIKFGYEGLGLFYTILEKLSQQEKPILTDVLKHQLKVGKKLEKIWNFMEEIELISSNNGETFNEQLLNFSEKYQIKKEKNAKRISKWRENQTDKKNVTCYESVSNTPKVNRSKVNKSKSIFIAPTIEDVKLYFKQNGYKEETAIKFFNSYSVANWIDSKGNNVKNWKQKAINVWFTDENKSNEKPKTIIIDDGIKRFDCIYDSDPKHYQHSEEEIKQHCAKYNTNLRAKV